VLDLKALNFLERFFLIILELIFPSTVEVLQVLMANFHILPHLVLLDVLSKVLLELHDRSLELPDFFHQILVKLVLVHLDAFSRKQLHFLLDERENENLLVLVQHTISALIKDVDELLG